MYSNTVFPSMRTFAVMSDPVGTKNPKNKGNVEHYPSTKNKKISIQENCLGEGGGELFNASKDTPIIPKKVREAIMTENKPTESKLMKNVHHAPGRIIKYSGFHKTYAGGVFFSVLIIFLFCVTKTQGFNFEKLSSLKNFTFFKFRPTFTFNLFWILVYLLICLNYRRPDRNFRILD